MAFGLYPLLCSLHRQISVESFLFLLKTRTTLSLIFRRQNSVETAGGHRIPSIFLRVTVCVCRWNSAVRRIFLESGSASSPSGRNLSPKSRDATASVHDASVPYGVREKAFSLVERSTDQSIRLHSSAQDSVGFLWWRPPSTLQNCLSDGISPSRSFRRKRLPVHGMKAAQEQLIRVRSQIRTYWEQSPKLRNSNNAAPKFVRKL